MSIQFTKAYVAAGNTYATLKEAQIAEITALVDSLREGAKASGLDISMEEIANVIVENAEKVVDVLTTTEKSRPTARRVNGGRKPRKAKAGQQEQSPTAEAQ